MSSQTENLVGNRKLTGKSGQDNPAFDNVIVGDSPFADPGSMGWEEEKNARVLNYISELPQTKLSESHAGIEDDVKHVTPTYENVNPSEVNNEGGQELWDLFRMTTTGGIADVDNERLYEMMRKVFKLVTYVVLFCVILASAIINKGTLLYAASNIRQNISVECQTFESFQLNSPINTTPRVIYSEHTKCILLSEPDDTQLSCMSAVNRTPDGPYEFKKGEAQERKLCNAVTVRWIWCLFLIIISPSIFVFLRSFNLLVFKNLTSRSDAKFYVVAILIESLQAIGSSILAFRVLPSLDSYQCLALMLAVFIIPAFFRIFFRDHNEQWRPLKIVLDIVAFVFQLSALLVWPITEKQNTDIYWALPLSLLLISLGWWENFIGVNHKDRNAVGKFFYMLHKGIHKSRSKIYLIVGPIKCLIVFCCVLFLKPAYIEVSELFQYSCDSSSVDEKLIGRINYDWALLWLINVLMGLTCYFAARTAAKVQIQRISYAIPLILSTPLALIVLSLMCYSWNNNPCQYSDTLPMHAFFSCHPKGNYAALWTKKNYYFFFVWYLSALWISRHIWFPKSERLAKTSRIFLLPLFDNLLLEQSLLLNRNRDDETKRSMGKQISKLVKENAEKSIREGFQKKADEIPLIYLCATMWHESEEEMISMLKSFGRLDKDQFLRKMTVEHMKIEDPDFYNFEAHIFFDDAMQPHGYNETNYKVNDYVKKLVKCVDIAFSIVHDKDITLGFTTKYTTPYGGRLEWTMPGGNKIVAHLKDKVLIRHKKRWSQVMYMYYFLGHRIMNSKDSASQKQRRADNTFLFALDGDVDFHPNAVTMLVDLMKKDPKVGAACGRIHPIGSGPMVWYQKFEYALGHWMQKATEHVFGCVLCSPGCFSLFRGSALMDDDVMKTYTTMSTKPEHFVQYDQGEDRWLCTLLLQAGHRVEYSAASDALTNAPETFDEFYKQRRRWMPSTMANIVDLLSSWRRTVKKNENISLLFVFYQILLFAASVIGPGSIFLMMVGALEVSLNLEFLVCFFINLVPVVIFIILCYTASSDTQLWMGSILTTIYAVVQMLVLVGIITKITQEGVCSSTSVFLFFVAGTFIFAAVIHPQEFSCVIHGFMYYLSIPSMYMLLMMYSITNLNVVSWGTREVKQTKTEAEEQREKQLLEEQKKLEKRTNGDEKTIFSLMNLAYSKSKEDGFLVSFGNLFKCLCCPRPSQSNSNTELKITLEKLKQMEEHIDVLHAKAHPPRSVHHHRTVSFNENIETKQTGENYFDEETREKELTKEKDKESNKTESSVSEIVRPQTWFDDVDLGEGAQGIINSYESNFFKQLIAEYLFPLDPNKKEQEQAAIALKELRNKMAFTFYLVNIIFVVTVSALQAQSKSVFIPWVICEPATNLNPIGFTFLIIFGSIMIVQIVGMIIHRLGTFLHIVSITKLNCGYGKETISDFEKAYEFTSQVFISSMDNSAEDDDDRTSIMSTIDRADDRRIDNRRKTVHRLLKGRRTTMRARAITTATEHATTAPAGAIDEPVPGVARSATMRIAPDTLDTAFRQKFQKLREQIETGSATDEDIERTIRGPAQRKIQGLKKRDSLKMAIDFARKSVMLNRKRDTRQQTIDQISTVTATLETDKNASPKSIEVDQNILMTDMVKKEREMSV